MAEQMGSQVFGWTGVKIDVAGKNLPDFPLSYKDKEHRILLDAVEEAGRLVTKALEEIQAVRNQEFMNSVKAEKQSLISLFPDQVFVEEIKNGYGSGHDWYDRMKPWFKITVPKTGHFVIGWRKRVIHLEWTGTSIKEEAKDLFPFEEVTKHEKVIHCWGLDKAREYVNILITKA